MPLKTHNVRPATFEELYRRYSEVVDWLSKSVRVGPQCRLQQYLPYLRKLSLNKSNATRLRLFRDTDVVSAFFEANEIVDALGPFAEMNSKFLIPRLTLKGLPSGVQNYPAIKNNDPSRESFFELFIASRLIQNHAPIILGHKTCDVFARLYGYDTFIECKRISSDAKFVIRTKEAIGQLGERYSAKSKEAGIAFLAIDQAVNPQLTLIKLRDEFHLKVFIEKSLKKYSSLAYLGQITSQFETMPQQKTMAYFMRLSFPYYLESRSSIGFNSTSYFSSFFSTTDSSYFRFFERIEKKWMKPAFPSQG